ncbi:hypothetical protein FB379_11794 [Aeribacillus composti]|uniref:phage tail fiber protein n=1 Tax=Aeribacillus composti TaxID=1868734 RepID=UPI00119B687A|nr:hypothetical protein [Aeribacillus composti]TVZ81295.1 hypothetical protein FB379_11794 [Aeribacillus composti]
MSMTDYLETQILNAIFKGETYTGPSALYLALFTSDPGDNGEGTEVSDSAYARQEIIFSEITDGTVSNTNLIEFAPAAVNYGVITHVGIYDSQTGGNLLFYSELATSIVAGQGVGVSIQPGDLSVSLD